MATNSTMPMNTRSKAFVSIGRKPWRRGIVGSTGASMGTSGRSTIPLSLDGAEGEAGDDVALRQAEEEERRQQRQHRGGGHLAPVRAGDGDELGESRGDGAGVHAGQRRGE